MRWLRVRKAKSIPDADREMFERFGAAIFGAVLYGGFSGPQATGAQKALYENPGTRLHAEAWLTEQYDRAERKETWSITMEAAITVFVAVELVLSVLNFVSHRG